MPIQIFFLLCILYIFIDTLSLQNDEVQPHSAGLIIRDEHQIAINRAPYPRGIYIVYTYVRASFSIRYICYKHIYIAMAYFCTTSISKNDTQTNHFGEEEEADIR